MMGSLELVTRRDQGAVMGADPLWDGKHLRYRHRSNETVDRLKEHGASIMVTEQQIRAKLIDLGVPPDAARRQALAIHRRYCVPVPWTFREIGAELGASAAVATKAFTKGIAHLRKDHGRAWIALREDALATRLYRAVLDGDDWRQVTGDRRSRKTVPENYPPRIDERMGRGS